MTTTEGKQVPAERAGNIRNRPFDNLLIQDLEYDAMEFDREEEPQGP